MSIVIDRVSKRYNGRVALDALCVTLPAGSLTALVGPNGCGKSTLLRLVAGGELPDSGEICVFGEQAHRAGGRADVDGAPTSVLLKLDELLHVDEFKDRDTASLSQSERRRLVIAQTFAVRSRLLVLDDPFEGLDHLTRREMRRFLRALHDDVQTTTVLATPDVEEAMEIADAVAVMRHGRIEQLATPRMLYEKPASAFVMRFVGAVNEVGDAFVRPHDIDVRPQPIGESVEAMVERISYVGFDVRVQLALGDGRTLCAQVTRDEAEELDIATGQIVYVRPSRWTSFGQAARRGLIAVV